MNKADRNRRADATSKKSVYLTPRGRSAIEGWAQQNKLNFSAAIETLALLGLDKGASDFIVPALRDVTLQGIKLATNRFAHLLSRIEANSVLNRMMLEAVLLQLIRELADEHPDDFEAIMRVPRDSQRQRDLRIRRFHSEIKRNLSQAIAERLRQSLDDATDSLTQ